MKTSGAGSDYPGFAPSAPHVLVVDDEVALRRNLVRVLESRGMRAGQAESGPHALEYVARTPPEVALVDVTIPGLTGLEVLARIQAMGSPCEVVLMTAAGDVDSAVAALRAGAYHFLTKPLHSNDAVAHAVNRAAQHRRLAARAARLEQALASKVTARDVSETVRSPGQEGEGAWAVPWAELAGLPYAEAKRRVVTEFDEAYTSELLRRASGNMSEAARRAGVDRSNFRRLLKRHKVES